MGEHIELGVQWEGGGKLTCHCPFMVNTGFLLFFEKLKISLRLPLPGLISIYVCMHLIPL